MTPEICEDLANFSFDRLQDVVKESKKQKVWHYWIHSFPPSFIECVKRLVCYRFYSCILYVLII